MWRVALTFQRKRQPELCCRWPMTDFHKSIGVKGSANRIVFDGRETKIITRRRHVCVSSSFSHSGDAITAPTWTETRLLRIVLEGDEFVVSKNERRVRRMENARQEIVVLGPSKKTFLSDRIWSRLYKISFDSVWFRRRFDTIYSDQTVPLTLFSYVERNGYAVTQIVIFKPETSARLFVLHYRRCIKTKRLWIILFY